MRRREFITLTVGAAAAWPIAAHAQQAGKLPTIGFLGAGAQSAWTHWTAAFVQRLHELGWIEGRTVTIEYRWAEGRTERPSRNRGRVCASQGGCDCDSRERSSCREGGDFDNPDCVRNCS